MELRNLYSFLRVAELGSFTKAAEALGYAQSTVTTQIQQLEADIGLPLLERIGKKTCLTITGQQIVSYANQMLQLESQMRLFNRTAPEVVSGPIRIGIVGSIMNSVLLSVLEEYRQTFPHVNIEIRLAVTNPLFELLRKNEVDIILTMGEIKEVTDCVRVCSHPERAVFIAPPEHPLVREKQIPLPDIFDNPIILTGDNTYLQRELRKLAYSCGREVISNIQTESSRIILDLVRMGMGISFLPEYLVRMETMKNHLAILPVTKFSLDFYTHIYYHKNKWVTPQMTGLIALVKKYWSHMDEMREESEKERCALQ